MELYRIKIDSNKNRNDIILEIASLYDGHFAKESYKKTIYDLIKESMDTVFRTFRRTIPKYVTLYGDLYSFIDQYTKILDNSLSRHVYSFFASVEVTDNFKIFIQESFYNVYRDFINENYQYIYFNNM